MCFLDSVLDCFTDSLYPCVEADAGLTGTRTRGGLPAVSCPVTITRLSLPQDDGCVRLAARNSFRNRSRCLFRYGDVAGFKMPMATSFGAYLASPIVFAIGQGVAQHRAHLNESEATQLVGDRARFNSFDDFRKLIIEYPVPAVADRWRQDRAWCDQLLAGFDPITIKRVTHEQPGIGIDWKMLSSKLHPEVSAAVARALGEDIDGGIATGRLYVADYVELKDAGYTMAAQGAQSGQIPMAPIALFVRAQAHGGLDPIAIQMDQQGESGYCLPDDSPNWIVARSYAQAASYQLTQIVYHLTLHHLVGEAFALSTMRQFPECHPLSALLGHHFSGLMPINTGTLNQFFGEATESYLLVGKQGGQNLVNARYERWHFDQLDFATDLKRRGMDDPTLLPYYPYRDDLLLHWNLLRDYTREYLALFYGDPLDSEQRADRNVAEDFELQAWAVELSREAGGCGNVPGFPPSITSFAELHQIVHRLIFMAGPHHASLNFSQLDYGSFVPNMPAATYLLPPATGANESTLLNLLAPAKQAIGQTTMSYQAAYYMGQLLDYADYFCGAANRQARAVVQHYRDLLVGEVTETIHKRNQQRERQGALSYPYALPTNVPNSTCA